MLPVPPSATEPAHRRAWGPVIAWAFYDWGAAGYITIVAGFVFSVYLTDVVGADLPGAVSANTWLGWSLAAAGIVIAAFAPIAGQRSDARGRRRRSLAGWTGLTVATIVGLFFVRPEPGYLWFGLVLLALGSVFFNLAAVSYNAMLLSVSTPRTIGRVSAFGWSMGSLGGIVLLLLCLAGFLAPDGGWFGIGTADALNVRAVALVAAGWFVLFAVPVLIAIPDPPSRPGPATGRSERVGLRSAYQRLARDVRDLFRADRHTIYFLGASALYRDGLSTLGALAAVQAVTVYGLSSQDVLIFGVLSSVVGAIGALAGGPFDDRFGPKPVIVVSLSVVVAISVILTFMSGPAPFWIAGLVISALVGPVLSSSRTYLARLTPPGRQGEMFGLYAASGRAVSFLAPAVYGLFILVFDAERAGMAGLVLVIALGLLALIPVRRPARAGHRPGRSSRHSPVRFR